MKNSILRFLRGKYGLLVGIVLVLLGVTGLSVNAMQSDMNTVSVSKTAAKQSKKEVKSTATTVEKDAPKTVAASTKSSTGSSAPSANQAPSASAKRQLAFSPSSIVLPPNGQGVGVYVSALDNTSLFKPSVASAPGISASLAVEGGGSAYTTTTKWVLMVTQVDQNSSGHANLVVKTSNGYSGTISVSWNAIPKFSAVAGGLVRTETATTITYTASFTLTTNAPFFGNPTMTKRIGGDDGKCINKTELVQSWVYNGQNQHSMSCVIARRDPSVPAQPTTLYMNVEVTGATQGAPILGTLLLFSVPWPFDL